MQIEEAIEIMNNFIKDTPKAPFECLMNKEVEAVETLLNELEKKDRRLNRQFKLLQKKDKIIEKQDKVIDEMAEKLVEAHEWFYSEYDNYSKEYWKEYFYKKVSNHK